ncbi:DUF4286 family protein [Paraburkholderia flagellata]|uniref:DUF4286 family protein n=1 Tax=Paraburkholderia flagellata TaxID=2883241 RepID=UPI001F238BF9|nr:DUF4286 family protein [Paraburkholderia flagellata]
MKTGRRGMLFVAADVGREDEEDFNEWYDREHLEDRVRMNGVIAASRYVAVDGGPKYLALYWAGSIEAFDSPEYAHAFKNQTPWSQKVLPKMLAPTRRIGELSAEVGKGNGGFVAVLALLVTETPGRLSERCAAVGEALAQQPGFVRSYLLTPDDTLSRPLPLEDLSTRRIAPIFIIESSSTRSSESALSEAIDNLPCAPTAAARYALAWNLESRECS